MKPPEATQFLSSASAADIAPAMLSAQPGRLALTLATVRGAASGGLPPVERELRHLPASPHRRTKFKKER